MWRNHFWVCALKWFAEVCQMPSPLSCSQQWAKLFFGTSAFLKETKQTVGETTALLVTGCVWGGWGWWNTLLNLLCILIYGNKAFDFRFHLVCFILGPPFTHLRTPHKMVYFGDTSCEQETERYLDTLKYVFSAYERDVPLIINTMGWVKGKLATPGNILTVDIPFSSEGDFPPVSHLDLGQIVLRWTESSGCDLILASELQTADRCPLQVISQRFSTFGQEMLPSVMWVTQ